MCQVICVANQKGGCSKTSVCLNLGIGLVREGKKVALVDADPQGSLTASLGYAEPDELKVTLATILMDVINEEEFDPTTGILHHPEGVDLIPANIELSGLEVSLATVVMSRELILRDYIDKKNKWIDDEQRLFVVYHIVRQIECGFIRQIKCY